MLFRCGFSHCFVSVCVRILIGCRSFCWLLSVFLGEPTYGAVVLASKKAKRKRLFCCTHPDRYALQRSHRSIYSTRVIVVSLSNPKPKPVILLFYSFRCLTALFQRQLRSFILFCFFMFLRLPFRLEQNHLGMKRGD